MAKTKPRQVTRTKRIPSSLRVTLQHISHSCVMQKSDLAKLESYLESAGISRPLWREAIEKYKDNQAAEAFIRLFIRFLIEQECRFEAEQAANQLHLMLQGGRANRRVRYSSKLKIIQRPQRAEQRKKTVSEEVEEETSRSVFVHFGIGQTRKPGSHKSQA